MANEWNRIAAALLNANAANGRLSCFKISQGAEGASTWSSLWKVGPTPAAGANPPVLTAGAGYQQTKALTGALQFANAPAGYKKHLLYASAVGQVQGTLILWDRLWACSNFVTNTTAAQPITTPGIIPARDGNGAALGDGCELWGEVYTVPGATGATWTSNYIASDGNAAVGTYTHPANAETANQMFPFVRSSGAQGVRGVDAANPFVCSVSSGTAGVIGLTIMRPICRIPIALVNAAPQPLDFIGTSAPRIYDDSCLFFSVQCTTTSTGIITCDLVLGDVPDA